MKVIFTSAALLVGAGILLAIIIGSAGPTGWPGLQYHNDMLSKGADIAAALFVVAVFLERAMAVINGIAFKQEEARIEGIIATAAATAALKEMDATAAASIQTKAETDLRGLEAKKTSLRLGLGFVVAVLVSAAGARTLAGLVTAPPGAGDQGQLFVAMDILLTAGLLAGGSNGIALLIKVLREQLKNALEQTRVQRRRLHFTGNKRIDADCTSTSTSLA